MMIRYSTVIIFSLLILASTSLLAQGTSKPTGENIRHGRNYFLKMEYLRLSEILNAATAQQAKENRITGSLILKNDSLLSAGNIYDSVSLEIKKQLEQNKYRIDSLNTLISSLNQQLNSSSFKKEYSRLVPAIAGIGFQTSTNAPVNEKILQQIRHRLDTSNLSGEKGKLKTMLNSASGQLSKEGEKAGEIGNKKEQALKSGNVDESVSIKIDNRLKAYQHRMDSLSTEIKELSQKIDSPKDFSKDFKIIKAKIILIDSVVNKGAASREYIFRMIDDGLDKSTQKLFELAAFFGPGGYIIPETKYEMARTYFSPVIDSLVKFSNNYSSVLRTASIIVNGYSDATSISVNSKLFKTLSAYLNNSTPDKQQLNTALSALRAEEISKFLSRLLKEKYPDFKSIDKIIFENFEVGQGEKFPTMNIKDYKINDARRRVVTIYWSILPVN